MQTQLHKNNDPARIRVESKKQDTIQKKTDDPNKNLFQKTLETPKSNPFLNALMPPTQSKLSTGQTTDSSSPTITETSAEAPPNQQGHCLYQQKSLTILSSRNFSLFDQDFERQIPMMSGTVGIYDLGIQGKLDLILKAHPSIDLKLGPVLLRNLCLYLDWANARIGLRATLDSGLQLRSDLDSSLSLDSQLNLLLPSVPPILIPLLGLPVNLNNRLRLRGSSDFKLPIDIYAAISEGKIGTTLNPRLGLGLSIDNELDIEFILQALATEICRYTHPLADLSAKAGIQLGFDLDTGLKFDLDLKKWKAHVEPYLDFKPVLEYNATSIASFLENLFQIPTLNEGWQCRSLQEIIKDLLREGVISEAQREDILDQVQVQKDPDKAFYRWGHKDRRGEVLTYNDSSKKGADYTQNQHHVWPKTLGGKEDQSLMPVIRTIHYDEIHYGKNPYKSPVLSQAGGSIYTYLTNEVNQHPIFGKKGENVLKGGRLVHPGGKANDLLVNAMRAGTDAANDLTNFVRNALHDYYDLFRENSTSEAKLPKDAYQKGLDESQDELLKNLLGNLILHY